jgi:hypothetical protein
VNTVSSPVKKSVCPPPRDRNFTRGSTCPLVRLESEWKLAVSLKDSTVSYQAGGNGGLRVGSRRSMIHQHSGLSHQR